MTDTPDPKQPVPQAIYLQGASGVTDAVVTLVRDHGLVVFAILSLVWQVYYLSGQLQGNEERWRATVDALRAQIDVNASRYAEMNDKAIRAVAELTEVSRVTQTIIAAVEEECLRTTTLQELNKQLATPPKVTQ